MWSHAAGQLNPMLLASPASDVLRAARGRTAHLRKVSDTFPPMGRAGGIVPNLSVSVRGVGIGG